MTSEQVQQLAALHRRPFQPPPCPLPVLQEGAPPQTLVEIAPQPEPACEATSTKIINAFSPSSQQEIDLLQKLSHLETQVATMQQQLAQLAMALLKAQTQRNEQRLQTLEALLQPIQLQVTLPPVPEGGGFQAEGGGKGRLLHPAEQRAQLRVPPPLIEYGATGTYVVIDSQEGERDLTPDTAEWFEWFRTLSSFRFVGQCGRFGACRGYRRRPTRTWQAHRTIHQREYKLYLGLSEHLTIACLEEIAAKFQSYIERS